MTPGVWHFILSQVSVLLKASKAPGTALQTGMAPRDINAAMRESSQPEKRFSCDWVQMASAEGITLQGCSGCCAGPLRHSFGSAIPIIPDPGLLQFCIYPSPGIILGQRGLLCPRLCFFLRENLYWMLFCDLLTQLDWLRVLFICTAFQPLLLTILLPPSLACSAAENRPNKPRTERHPS